MKIIFKPEGTTDEILLANGATRELAVPRGPSGRVVGQRSLSVDPGELLRSEWTIPEDLKNRSTSYSFGVTYEFETPQLAEVFEIDHKKDLPNKGTLAFIYGEDPDIIRFVYNAIVQNMRTEQEGVRVDVFYTFVGGEIGMPA